MSCGEGGRLMVSPIRWPSKGLIDPWRFQLYFNEIKELSSSISVEFHHVGMSANGFAD